MILIIDDDESVRLALRLLLRHAGYEVMTADGPEAALEAVRSHPVSLVVMDMNFTLAVDGREGLELLRKVRVLRPALPVILITAWGSIPLAVEGMRAGANDFVTKPWDNADLLSRINTALKLASAATAEADGDAGADDESGFDRSGIIGSSSGLREVLQSLKRVAPTDAPVLILGENGTGKEMIARAIHANSRRASGPFVAVNLGGIPHQLFESEMFGHARGAFTGAVADRKGRFDAAAGGTIFLDEIGELHPESQVKMLRVLQEHTYEALGDNRPRRADVRVVCATNVDLARAVEERAFREDLYYRINLITLRLPPLRERTDDIEPLARHFAALYARSANMPQPDFHPSTLRMLRSLPWPGNIRQLRNSVESAIIVSGASTLLPEHFGAAASQHAPMTDAPTLDSLEKRALERALDEAGGNMSQAARALGLTRQSLYRRMEKHGLK